MDSLLKRFEAYIRENSLLTPGDKVLAAVSGGVDSMVMLSLLVKAGYDVSVAHCNFQLRGNESFEDEELVAGETRKYGIPFYNMRFDTAGEMERTGESVQLAARRLRYAWFRELGEEHGYTVVAIAHHADDSIETFFINLFRGTGLRGLTGIGVVNGRVVRPMLFATRKDILDYAVGNGIRFREDSSNRSTKYLRNKIRLGLVPRLKDINPGFAERMGLNIKRLTDAQAFVDASIARIRENVEDVMEGFIVIDPSLIDDSYPRGFVIYELLSAYGFKGNVVDELCASLDGGATGKRFYSKENVAHLDRGKIIVTPIAEGDTCEITIPREVRKSYCGNSALHFEFLDVDSIENYRQPENVALLDANKLIFPLTARKWKEGDKFRPLGMDSFKKVSDFLVDEKVSMPEKLRQFVLLSGEDIVWIAGRRIDNGYRITDLTETVLKITKEIV